MRYEKARQILAEAIELIFENEQSVGTNPTNKPRKGSGVGVNAYRGLKKRGLPTTSPSHISSQRIGHVPLHKWRDLNK